MFHIITTTQVQQKIGKISDTISEQSYIVTNRGEGRIVMLPYFEGCDTLLSDYMEDFEMWKNRKKLKEKYKESSESGAGTLKI